MRAAAAARASRWCAVAALAADPGVLARSGQVVTTSWLASEYGFTDIDGRQQSPFWDRHWAGTWG